MTTIAPTLPPSINSVTTPRSLQTMSENAMYDHDSRMLRGSARGADYSAYTAENEDGSSIAGYVGTVTVLMTIILVAARLCERKMTSRRAAAALEEKRKEKERANKRIIGAFVDSKCIMVVATGSVIDQHPSPSGLCLEDLAENPSESTGQTSPAVDVVICKPCVSVPQHQDIENPSLPSSNIDLDKNENHYLVLPRSEISDKSSIVPNCCAICLDDYIVNEEVVWSPLFAKGESCCSHAYHLNCITEYTHSNKRKAEKCPSGRKMLCPMCRETFFILPNERSEDKSESSSKFANAASVATESVHTEVEESLGIDSEADEIVDLQEEPSTLEA